MCVYTADLCVTGNYAECGQAPTTCIMGGSCGPVFVWVQNRFTWTVYYTERIVEFQEIARCVRKLKNNKTGGSDGLVGELLKYGGSGMIHLLHKLFEVVWSEELVPQKWREGYLHVLLRAGRGFSTCVSECVLTLHSSHSSLEHVHTYVCVCVCVCVCVVWVMITHHMIIVPQCLQCHA